MHRWREIHAQLPVCDAKSHWSHSSFSGAPGGNGGSTDLGKSQPSFQQGQDFTLDNFSKKNWKRFLRISHVELTDILCLQLSNQAHARLCRRKVSLQMKLCFPWNTHTPEALHHLSAALSSKQSGESCLLGTGCATPSHKKQFFFFFWEKYKESSRIIQLLMLKVGLQD